MLVQCHCVDVEIHGILRDDLAWRDRPGYEVKSPDSIPREFPPALHRYHRRRKS
jgi:hypothetical protein